ncbi:MAG: hypothetical protein HBSIN02_08270 [Bacteroidia bacterium]|nr:MAG: hypothetical protein HBSIN02_08270 [Bacteroidia bacterium]
MRTTITILLCILLSSGSIAQATAKDEVFGISASMGIDVLSAPAIADYLTVIAGSAERVDEFTSAVEFAVAPEIRVAREWSAGLEYAYLIKSYSLQSSGGSSNVFLGVHLPTLLVQYVIRGERTRIRVGGGVGPVFGTMEEQLYGSTSGRTFRARGTGLKLEAAGASKFDDHFFALISVDMRWIAGGTFNDGTAEARFAGTTADLDLFTLGLKFGVGFIW